MGDLILIYTRLNVIMVTWICLSELSVSISCIVIHFMFRYGPHFNGPFLSMFSWGPYPVLWNEKVVNVQVSHHQCDWEWECLLLMHVFLFLHFLLHNYMYKFTTHCKLIFAQGIFLNFVTNRNFFPNKTFKLPFPVFNPQRQTCCTYLQTSI